MEDDVKIYRGPTQLVPSFQFTNSAPTPPYSYKSETRWETLQRVIEEHEEETRRLRQKYPAFDVVYRSRQPRMQLQHLQIIEQSSRLLRMLESKRLLQFRILKRIR